MGLNDTDLIAHVEEAFGITIDDEDAGGIYTVDELCLLVMTKLSPAGSGFGLTAPAFYRLRRAMVKLGVDRQNVRPDTPLDKLLPASHRRKAWVEITTALSLKVPELVHPLLYYETIVFTYQSLLESSAGLALLKKDFDIFWSGLMMCNLSLFLINMMTTCLANRFPPDCETVGEMVKTILRENYGRLADLHQGWDEREVRAAIKDLIVEELCVWPDLVKPQARFDKDLEMA